MRTVKEVSQLTGISVRTLHYYHEIGLLAPTKISEGGYRLYDDKALEQLQQILFFREFGVALKEIKAILSNPEFDQKQILISQKKMLVSKKERLERMITSIDNILKGEYKMDFEVFNQDDVQKMFDSMIRNMTDEQREIFIKEYGSMEQFEKSYFEDASSEQAQENLAKVVEWYGDKETAMEVSMNPDNRKTVEENTKKLDAVTKQLASMLDDDINSCEVRHVVKEYIRISGEMWQMKDPSVFCLDMAKMYQTNENLQKNQDKIYGAGSSIFIGQAVEAFLNNPG